MLLGENLGRRHESGLIAGFDRLARGECGDDGLATADVALQQTLHGEGLRQIGRDLGDHSLLRAGQAEGKRREQLARERARRTEQRRAFLPSREIGAAQ